MPDSIKAGGEAGAKAPVSPFVPGDLVEEKSTGKQGTITRTPSNYYSEVHMDGIRRMIPNEWLVVCNLLEDPV